MSDEHHDLLVACRTEKMLISLILAWNQHRLYVFDANDLSDRGFVRLPSDSDPGFPHPSAVQSALAKAEGRAYLLTVEGGKRLQVFEVPGQP